MAGKYYVHAGSVAKSAGSFESAETWGPYALAKAKDFARIGSQKGRYARAVTRGKSGPVVRVYKKGVRAFPVTEHDCKGLTRGELPKWKRGEPKSAEGKSTGGKKNPAKLRPMHEHYDLPAPVYVVQEGRTVLGTVTRIGPGAYRASAIGAGKPRDFVGLEAAGAYVEEKARQSRVGRRGARNPAELGYQPEGVTDARAVLRESRTKLMTLGAFMRAMRAKGHGANEAHEALSYLTAHGFATQPVRGKVGLVARVSPFKAKRAR